MTYTRSSALDEKGLGFNPIRHGGRGPIVSAADSFVCCGSIKYFKKVKLPKKS